jgi:hypothetical protein
MRLSEFTLAVAEEFGADYGQVLLRDLVLPSLGGRTSNEALAAGVPAREVWLALCEANDVPAERRYGAGRPQPKNG